MPRKKDRNLHEEIVKHLQGDIKMYGSEAAEDRKLIKSITYPKRKDKESAAHERKEKKKKKK